MSARSDPSPDEIECERHRAGSAWTDRGTAFLVSGSPGSRQAAVRCHRRAVDLLSAFSPAPGRAAQADLGTAWVNLGCALQAGEDRGELAEAPLGATTGACWRGGPGRSQGQARWADTVRDPRWQWLIRTGDARHGCRGPATGFTGALVVSRAGRGTCAIPATW